MRYFWMQGRGTGSFSQQEVVQVYVNGQHAEGVSALRQIEPSTVLSVEYLGGIEATSRYGTGHGAGAIVVRTGA
jgi:outer membrane receptor protein involved in Fe transport